MLYNGVFFSALLLMLLKVHKSIIKRTQTPPGLSYEVDQCVFVKKIFSIFINSKH